jgi:hypothetical protein
MGYHPRPLPGEKPAWRTFHDRRLFDATRTAAALTAVVGIVLVLVGNEAARLVGWNLAVLGALGVVVGAVSHAAQARQRLRERDDGRDDYAGPREAGW